MVRAILRGQKTQTRRVIKGPAEGYNAHGINTLFRCPYGKPGDILWVRETWAEVGSFDPGITVYRADYPDCIPGQFENVPESIEEMGNVWKPSIHMHRHRCRLLLEIVSVRAERLHDLSQEDAKAEGLSRLSKDGGATYKYGIPDRDGLPGNDNDGWHWHEWEVDPRKAFKLLWAKINGVKNWYANPWVWVVEFKRVTADE